MSGRSAIELIDELNALQPEAFADAAERNQAKQALLRAYRRVQTPWDIGAEHIWANPMLSSAVRTLIDAGFWQKWSSSGKEIATVEELSTLSGVDAAFLQRLLRALAGQGFVEEPAPSTFAATSYTKALADDRYPSIYKFGIDFMQPCINNFPKFAGKTGFTNPVDSSAANYQDWQGNGEDFFSAMRKNQTLAQHFNNSMTIYAASKAPWTAIYPTESIIHGAKEGRALVVDVAGGVGHDLEKFRVKHPGLPPSSLILQDQPKVVAEAKLQPPCVAQEHDIFTPQTVKGARAYYIHTVLHDWADEQVIQILKNLALGMDKGYSKILIHERMVAEHNANPAATISDLTMMMIFSAGERTEKRWRALIRQAGCEVVKIWAPEAEESIIEVELS